MAFGFPIYDSLVDSRPDIAYPAQYNRVIGGHAVLAVGYDETHDNQLTDTTDPAFNEKYGKGAVLIRNSWGPNWGDNGYGWLPFGYFEDSLATDLWTIFKQSWINDQPFQ